MNKSKLYHLKYFTQLLVVVLIIFAVAANSATAQKTGGKKLQTTEKSSPSKMDEGKVKTKKRKKIKGNPNKGANEVKLFRPFKWNWNKIMPFKAKKRDYETNEYNPPKKTRHKQYDNKPNYQTESRKPGDSDVKLQRPLIPFDPSIAEEGKIVVKKRKNKKIDPNKTTYKEDQSKKKVKTDGDKLYSKRDDSNRKAFDNSKLETANESDYKGTKMDNDKLMTIKRDDDPRKPFDDKKLMTSSVPDYKKTKMDDDKLMTVTVKKERKPFDDDKLMRPITKIERSKLHSDKLLTVPERQYPSATMKRITEDIAKYEGDYVLKRKMGKDYHPSSRYLSARRHGIPWLARTQQSLSMFWSKIWRPDLQPSSVKEKKPKLRRDKKEGQIWDNSVHPDEWRKAEEKPESGQSEN